MIVRVAFIRGSAARLMRWVVQSGGSPIDRDRMYRFHLEEIERMLISCDGNIPGATRVAGVSPPLFWWQYMPDLWVQFCLRDQRRFLSGKSREITVTDIADRPY